MIPGLDTVQIVIPPTGGVGTGNRLTAERWASMLRERVVSVSVTEGDAVAPVDLLIVLHGLKCRRALLDFRARHPGGRVILVLTGTDIYGDHDDGGDHAALHDSMAAADRLVVLQDKAIERIPSRFHDRTRVILQSVEPSAGSGAPRSIDPFVICVVGHVRDVKDPLRAATAARLLPAGSRVVIRHAGAVLEERYHALIAREVAENHRYEHLGEVGATDARRLIATAQAIVLSSRSEGGPAVIGEAVVDGTPILASRIAGAIGLLGEDYPGYFPTGDTAALADLIRRLEGAETFRAVLQREVSRLAPRFDPTQESRAWDALIDDVMSA